MDNASLFQAVAWAAVALGALVFIVVGHWPRLNGSYAEGDRQVQLRHIGPLIWGQCTLGDGLERYRGTALWGHCLLRRHDHGERLLLGRGFTAQQAQELDGLCTGHFRLQRTGDGSLVGQFFGRRFTAAQGRLKAVETLAPIARTWRKTADGR